MKHVKNINDIKLLQAGWIYDINFKPTFYLIKEYRYLEMIREALPESPEIDQIFDIINSYRFNCMKYHLPAFFYTCGE
jgi:hypothetical protein